MPRATEIPVLELLSDPLKASDDCPSQPPSCRARYGCATAAAFQLLAGAVAGRHAAS